MRKESVYCFLVALSWLLNVSLLQAQEEASMPTYQDGESWQFKVVEIFSGISSSDALDGIYEIRRTSKGVVVNQVIDGKREPGNARSGLLRALLGLSTENRDLKFPLSPGQKWNLNYQFKAVGERKAIYRLVEVTVMNWEQVTTQAGTFKALKLRKEDGPPQGQVWVNVYYYSPETKSVIKSSYDTTEGGFQGIKREIELIKYEPGR